MTGAAPAGNDHMPALEGLGDKGAGQTPLFDIKDMGLLGGITKAMFGAAEQSVAQNFGGKDLMLPYTDNAKV